jgi:class 3 adenylate cyclase/dihydrofolate reductase
MKLIVTAFMTLDGVMEAPGFDEHRDGRNAWALRVQNEEDGVYNQGLVMGADAVLLGRKTWQIWAAFWPTAPESAVKDRLNSMPKYVVSRTLRRADWTNSHILSGDVETEVRRLKSLPGGELLVYGSADLVDEVLRHDLVDEYRLMIYPLILGSGKHLFRDPIDTHYLRLLGSRTFSSGVVLLTYVPQPEAPTSPNLVDYAWTPEVVRSLHAAQDVERVLATVLFTDIVDSTARAADLGDRAWRQLLDRHAELARSEVDRWHGRFVKETGDGILAVFDTPTRALRCAFALRDVLAPMGLEIRTALHTGEVEQRGDDVGGIAVHIAARALSVAGRGRVVVTRTVRDLATGTDLTFAPLGTVGLRGVPDGWELFDATLT